MIFNIGSTVGSGQNLFKFSPLILVTSYMHGACYIHTYTALLCVHNGESIGQFKCPLWASRLRPPRGKSPTWLESRKDEFQGTQACKKKKISCFFIAIKVKRQWFMLIIFHTSSVFLQDNCQSFELDENIFDIAFSDFQKWLLPHLIDGVDQYQNLK